MTFIGRNSLRNLDIDPSMMWEMHPSTTSVHRRLDAAVKLEHDPFPCHFGVHFNRISCFMLSDACWENCDWWFWIFFFFFHLENHQQVQKIWINPLKTRLRFILFLVSLVYLVHHVMHCSSVPGDTLWIIII